MRVTSRGDSSNPFAARLLSPPPPRLHPLPVNTSLKCEMASAMFHSIWSSTLSI